MTTTLEMPGTTRSPDGPCRAGPSRDRRRGRSALRMGSPPVSHDYAQPADLALLPPRDGSETRPDGRLQEPAAAPGRC